MFDTRASFAFTIHYAFIRIRSGSPSMITGPYLRKLQEDALECEQCLCNERRDACAGSKVSIRGKSLVHSAQHVRGGALICCFGLACTYHSSVGITCVRILNSGSARFMGCIQEGEGRCRSVRSMALNSPSRLSRNRFSTAVTFSTAYALGQVSVLLTDSWPVWHA